MFPKNIQIYLAVYVEVCNQFNALFVQIIVPGYLGFYRYLPNCPIIQGRLHSLM